MYLKIGIYQTISDVTTLTIIKPQMFVPIPQYDISGKLPKTT